MVKGTPPPATLIDDNKSGNIADELALITVSPLDSIALTLSLVPVPPPSTTPPLAYLGFSTLAVLVAVIFLTLDTPAAIAAPAATAPKAGPTTGIPANEA